MRSVLTKLCRSFLIFDFGALVDQGYQCSAAGSWTKLGKAGAVLAQPATPRSQAATGTRIYQQCLNVM